MEDWRARAEVVSGDGKQVFRQRIYLADTESFGTRKLRWPLDLNGRTWGALPSLGFTQPIWLTSSPQPK